VSGVVPGQRIDRVYVLPDTGAGSRNEEMAAKVPAAEGVAGADPPPVEAGVIRLRGDWDPELRGKADGPGSGAEAGRGGRLAGQGDAGPPTAPRSTGS